MKERRCPVTGATSGSAAKGGSANKNWWPNQLNLEILHQNPDSGNPMDCDFNYAEEFKKLDLKEIKKDLFKLILFRRVQD